MVDTYVYVYPLLIIIVSIIVMIILGVDIASRRSVVLTPDEAVGNNSLIAAEIFAIILLILVTLYSGYFLARSSSSIVIPVLNDRIATPTVAVERTQTRPQWSPSMRQNYPWNNPSPYPGSNPLAPPPMVYPYPQPGYPMGPMGGFSMIV